MKNFTVAIFLAWFFCSVSGYSKDSAEGFKQNPEYAVPSSNKTETPRQQQTEPLVNVEDKAQDRTPPPSYSEPKPVRGTTYRRRSSAPTQFSGERYGGNRELQEWERRHRPVPTSLPRARSGSRSSSFRSSRTDYQSDCSGSFSRCR